MHPYTNLPHALTPASFYILLALSCGDDLHGYILMATVRNSSFGSVEVKSGQLYPLLKKLIQAGLIEEAGLQPAGKSRIRRMYYHLTKPGLERLRNELKRLKHAVEIGETHGHFNDELPTDLRELIERLK
jgi:DNA-binding PadR family transcriptional regulator